MAFFGKDGESVVLGVRERNERNPEINMRVSNIEYRYIPLELDEVERFQLEQQK
jgi:hypothetical protein